MRWDVRKPSLGTSRVVCRFLLLPKTLRGECRWLEDVNIRQIWQSYEKACKYGTWKTVFGWVDNDWADDEPEVRGGGHVV